MRLYALHDGMKSEIDLALFPIKVDEYGKVRFDHNQSARLVKNFSSGYKSGEALMDLESVTGQFPLIGGDELIGTVSNWIVQI